MSTDSRPSSSHAGSKPGGGWTPPTVEELQALLPQYEIVSMLGHGGMGAVYKGRQKSLDRVVAIKILPPGLDNDDAKFVERFQNEARTMAKLNHPGIVSVYDFGETAEGQLYFIMEYVDGTDVAKMIKSSGKLPQDYALAITAHVCDALGYAHGFGVVHRDIKPANILINMQGQIKVADFGLAKMDDPAQTSGLTKTGYAMGTPDYVSPEALIMGSSIDGRADLYAIGVMLYQMLTGEIPRGMFQMPNVRSKGETDPRFDAIISKAMQTDRESRYQSAMELRRALDVILTTPHIKQDASKAIAAVPQQAVAETPGKRSAVVAKPGAKGPQPPQERNTDALVHTPPPSKSTGLWLGIAGAAVVVIGGAMFMFSGGKPKPAVASAPPAPPPVKVREPAKPSTPAPKPPPPKPAPAKVASTSVATGPVINLLPLVDPTKDALVGPWSMKNGELYANRSQKNVSEVYSMAWCALPYTPPEEYDVITEFTSHESSQVSLVLPLRSTGTLVECAFFAGSDQRRSHNFDRLDDRSAYDHKRNFEAAAQLDIKDFAGRHSAIVEVRRGSLRAVLDGQIVLDWTGDLKRFHIAKELVVLQNLDRLVVGRQSRPTTFHKIEVREVTGTGMITDNATKNSPITIPSVTTILNGHRYQLVKVKGLGWPEAKAQAEKMGGHLVTLTSAAENQVALALVRDTLTADQNYNAVWIGLSQTREGAGWQWVSGEPFSYAQWLPGEPSGKKHGGDWPFFVNFFHLPPQPDIGWNDHGTGDPNALRQSLGFLVEWDEDATPGTARSLFNGRDASGWTGPGGAPAANSWSVEGGTLSATQRTTLWSAETFGDCELEIEWKMGPRGNGGVFYLVSGTSELSSPEMQLCDPANAGKGKSGALYGLVPEKRDASKPLGEWNSARLVISGSKREHWINGELVCSYDATQFRNMPGFDATSGKFVLQANVGEVSYRNLKVRRLDASGPAVPAATPATALPAMPVGTPPTATPIIPAAPVDPKLAALLVHYTKYIETGFAAAAAADKPAFEAELARLKASAPLPPEDDAKLPAELKRLRGILRAQMGPQPAPPAAMVTSTDKSQSLFNGSTLDGWLVGGDPASFKVEDGCIKAAGPKGNLIYAGSGAAPAWTDFDLTMKVKTGSKANSGVWIHCPAQATGASAVALEVQISNDPGPQMTGSIFNIAPIAKQVVPNEQWFDLRVVVRGMTLTVFINGEKINEWTQPANWNPPAPTTNARLGSGSIGFQGYGGEIWIKDVRIAVQ